MKEAEEAIIFNSILCPFTGCHLWAGRVDGRGYGRLSLKGQQHSAHRLSYQTFKGAIPEGMVVCHKCDQPSCCNPGHLFLGTHQENVADKMRKNRHPLRRPDPRQIRNSPRSNDPDWWDCKMPTRDAVIFLAGLGVSLTTKTLLKYTDAKTGVAGKGPAFLLNRRNRRRLYSKADLFSWAFKRLAPSTPVLDTRRLPQ